MRLYGPRVFVKPDCGFAGIQGVPDSYPIVLRKLVDRARNVVVREVSSSSQ